ncbi:MAG: hypothetical protein NVSMB32_10120 [Actinomycetota bacterium]
MVTGAEPAEVNRRLGEQGLWAVELAPVHADLEDVFLELTQGSSVGGSGGPRNHRSRRGSGAP